MSKSLQDQLLKAGLANKKQAVKAKKAKNNKEKLKREGKEVLDEVQEAVQKAEQQKLAKDRELNELLQSEKQQIALKAQIKQLIEMNSIGDRGDHEFSFTDESVVKNTSVSEKQRRALVAGAIAIVKLKDRYHLVPRKTAEKLAERDQAAVVLLNTDSRDDEYDDEYADYKVPDDLMW